MIKSFARIIFKYLVNNRATASVPRTGVEASKVNCFMTYVTFKGDNEKLLVSRLDGLCDTSSDIVLKVSAEDEETKEFKHEKTVCLADIKKIKIRHFYGYYDLEYESLLRFIIEGYSRLDRIVVNLYFKPKSYIQKLLFSRKDIFLKNRIELLRYVVKKTLEEAASDYGSFGYKKYSFTAHTLAADKYSMRWYSHPHKNKSEKILKHLIESLVESGDLEKEGRAYVMTPSAMITLEKHDVEHNRHLDSLKIQRRIVYLTFTLVIIGLINSGIIKTNSSINVDKLPTLLINFVSYYVSEEREIWHIGDELVSPFCMETEWVSGDNFEAYAELYPEAQDFNSYQGKYWLNLIPIEPIHPEWPNENGIQLARKFPECNEVREGYGAVKVEENKIISYALDSQHPEDIESYLLLGQWGTEECERLVPAFKGACHSLVSVERNKGTKFGYAKMSYAHVTYEEQDYILPVTNGMSLDMLQNLLINK